MTEQIQSDARPPVVGISACILHEDRDRDVYDGRPLLYLEQSMATWLLRGGAHPHLVPFAPESTRPSLPVSIEEMAEGLDGLVLHGGADVAPESYGATPERPDWSGDRGRDVYELELVRGCLARDVPILGICRGIQLLNVALGGTLHQDVQTHVDGAIAHRDPDAYEDNVHGVEIEAGSKLSALYGDITEARVNSVHHQAIDALADELIVEARCAEDGVVEAVRRPGDGSYLAGIQWHPEFQDPTDDTLLDPMPLLEAFLDACRRR